MDRKRTSRGRQKIAIQRISKETDCFATFSKRRLGLFKKASELSALCGVDIGVLIYSPTGKPFSFFHPTMESVMARLHDPSRPLEDDVSRLIDACSRTRVSQLTQILDGLVVELEDEELKERELVEEFRRTGGVRGRGWWDEPIEEMDKEGTRQMMVWLQELKTQLGDELKIRSFLG